MKNAYRFLVFALIFFLPLLGGCFSGAPMDITGTAEYKGQSVDEGRIVFEPIDGKGESVEAPIQNGKFSLAVPRGEKKVRVFAAKMGKKTAKAGQDLLPEKFNTDTELQYMVTGRSQEFHFKR